MQRPAQRLRIVGPNQKEYFAGLPDDISQIILASGFDLNEPISIYKLYQLYRDNPLWKRLLDPLQPNSVWKQVFIKIYGNDSYNIFRNAIKERMRTSTVNDMWLLLAKRQISTEYSADIYKNNTRNRNITVIRRPNLNALVTVIGDEFGVEASQKFNEFLNNEYLYTIGVFKSWYKYVNLGGPSYMRLMELGIEGLDDFLRNRLLFISQVYDFRIIPPIQYDNKVIVVLGASPYEGRDIYLMLQRGWVLRDIDSPAGQAKYIRSKCFLCSNVAKYQCDECVQVYCSKKCHHAKLK